MNKNIYFSVIIPVFNEERSVIEVLKALKKYENKDFVTEYIIVDDGSTDHTVKNVKSFIRNKSEFLLVEHGKNKGKGSAVITGLKKTRGEFVLIQDADLEYNPKDIKVLFEAIINKKADIVYGTRLKRMPDFSRDEKNFAFLMHYIGNKLLSLLTSIMFGQWVTDMETGYKLFPRKALEGIKLNSKGFEFEPEITAKFMKRGYRIVETPISTNPRTSEEGKKLNALRDGPIAFWTLFKYRFTD